MKAFLTTLIALTFCFCLNAQDIRVLFVGNSYTYVNDLPNLLTSLAETNKKTIKTTSFTTGGARFMTHWQNEDLKQEIQKGNYDIMVLQGQSQEVAFPPNQFYQEVYPYAKKLDSLFKEYKPEGRVIYFMTWGYRYGDKQNCQFYSPFCSYETMSKELCKNYSTMASDFQSEVSPIGTAWLYLYNQDTASFDLHSQDYSHPNTKGSYFAACVLYTTIFQKEISSTYYFSLSEEEATKLQQTASLLFSNYTLTDCEYVSDLMEIEENPFSVYYNDKEQQLSITTTQNITNITVDIYNLMGVKVKQYTAKNTTSINLDVKQLNHGYYIAKIRTDNAIYTHAFVK